MTVSDLDSFGPTDAVSGHPPGVLITLWVTTAVVIATVVGY